jgi:hypothetical protein
MAGEVEEPEHVVVADVEEEVAGARVVAILDQLNQREPEKLLVELDGLFHVAADEGDMVDALDGAGGPLSARPQVFFPQPLPTRPDFLEFVSLGLWHGRLLRRDGPGSGTGPAG